MATLLHHQDQQLGQLSEVIHRLLSEKECYIFDRGLADYHRRRNVKSFVECLSIVLNTSNKRKLLIPIRDAYVKPSDLSKFNQLVPANGLATNRKKVKAEVKGNTDGVRKLEVKRDADGQWGFSIRGGSEHGIGIFVSWVEPGTNAEKSGLLVGDQILKANDANFDRISHYDAAMLVKNAKKLRLFVLAHGRVPGSRMAHKVYCWIDSEGRPASPPPDPFEIQDDSRNGEFKLINDADERKVTVMIDRGNELGISIRGGIEHGLGIYVSAVEEDSVAESYGLKIGDQILEVNGISFLGIVHADAANALRAQSCMVMKVKDVGKLPHSRMTTHSQTKWYPSPQGNTSSEDMKDAPVPFFRAGIGSQVMLGQQQDTLLHSGLLRDVAQSVLTEQELAMFMYLLNQYQQHGLTVNGLVTPLLNLLDTPEKLQLLTELRGLMKPHDMERFNELTVHKQIMAKKYGTKQRNDDGTNSSEDGGRDKIPQKLSPQLPGNHFHIPPPPTSIPPSTPSIQPVEVEETDDGDGDGDDDSWDKNWGSYDVTPIKSTHKAEKIDTSLIEERVRAETEYRLRSEFSDKEKRILEEQQQLLEKERAEREKSLSRKRDSMEREMKLREEAIKLEMAEKIRNEIENKMNAQLEEKEKALQLENERRLAEHKEREEQFQLTYETTKQKLEEDIWKEADERIREEYEIKRRQEREASLLRRSKVSQKAEAWDVEGRIRKELENKIRKECEEKVRLEMQKLKRQEDKERMEREEELEQQKREQKIAQLEAEEQSRIEIEEKIRRETEAKVRFEYEARLQHETEERARLAEEVKVRKAAEERLQIDRIELEKQKEKELEEIKKEQQRERVKREREEREREKREREEREREVREREKREREKREREEREKKKKGSPKEKREETERSRKINENLQSDQSVSPTPAELEEERFLEKQRLARDNQEREEERLRQQEVMADLNEKNKKEAEINKKKELERKREENLRKRGEQRKQKEIENKRKQEENIDQTDGSTRQPLDIEKKMKKKQELEHIDAIEVNSQKVKVNFGEDETGSMKKRRIKKVKEEKVEEDRRKAEDKLEKRLKQSKQGEAKSYGGFTDIKGTILHITVTKIVKKLGIAIDGGANTKQKAVIIREIAPEGCAAQTGMGMAVNQQILEVNGVSLFGLKHREVVMAIKNGFDGPLNKEIVFVVVDSQGT